MSVQPVKMSTGKKIAIGLAGAAAIGATVYAGLRGKASLGDTFEKSAKGYAKAIGVGYKGIASLLNEKAIQPALTFIKGVPSKVSGLFHKAKVEEAITEASVKA